MTRNELPRRNHPARSAAYIQTAVAYFGAEMNQCKELHRVRCEFHWAAWMEDHPVEENVNMAEVYANQTESEAEADARLSGDETEEWEEGDTVLPGSSQA